VPILLAAALLTPPAAGAVTARAKSAKPRAFASCAELVRHARRWEARTGGRVWAPVRGAPEGPLPPGTQREDGTTVVSAPAATPDGGFSTTNNQEEGVDEPDAVKTDGRRIFAASGGTLRAVAAEGTPRLLGSLTLSGSAGHELLLRGDTLLAISTAFAGVAPRPGGPGDTPVAAGTAPENGATGGASAGAAGFAPVAVAGATRIDEVDVSDPAAMRIRRTLTVDGAYVSARRNGDTARVVVSSSPYAIAVPAAARRAGGWLPRARMTDRRRGRTVRRFAVGCHAVRRPAVFSGLGMLTVLTIDFERGLPAVDSDALMTDAQTVYGSSKSLYVATQRWVDPATAPDRLPSGATTALHRFDASAAGRTDYRAGGEVPGYLLNQFSLSEHRGVLRVATTEEPLWANGRRAQESESFVTVLDQIGSRLERVGRVGGLGRGERIYSVRFLGDAGYVVTFRQVDPLYTLDLARPAAPRVAGELKLLGYSAYLHPVGADRLLGVGQDATEEGRAQGSQAVLFDVSDPAAPKLLGRLALGGSSSSTVEYDHRAFLHWPPTGLAVLPLQSYGERGSDRFAGAVGLGVTRGGLREAGRIVHEGPPGTVPISRSLVAAGRLFTLSERGILASDLSSLAPIAWVPFPA
jgi:beta propeller domain-containing protein